MSSTSPLPTTPAYDPADPHRSGVALVTRQLDELGIGEHWVQTGEQSGLRIVDRHIPPGHGWCRATSVYQALWPATADLCVEVDWYADQDIPAAEQEEHWATRLAAVTSGLESLGYAVQTPGPRRAPGVDRYQPLIVSRLPVGASPAPYPADGWDHLDVLPAYRWPARNPSKHLANVLDDLRMTNYVTRTLDTHLWPPYATAASVVLWTGPPNATMDDWASAIARVRRALRVTGYRVLDHRRPWNPLVDHQPYLIAYLREKPQ
ncbi:hypothetical protein [Streptomyces sp. GbtcB6]|uniref:hypothetical protein n=1 Tax=Streptomyces sp. GbtcB6 TaxID=2824751 RepID=UPI001C3062B4|nr:hypothetical protein [Streptomyces sp. GbtcB6]